MRLSLLDNRRNFLLYLDENKTIPKYTVTWKNWDGSDLYVDTAAPEGGIPGYAGPTPTKPATQTVRYEFAGWEPAITAVTGDTTYTAAFTEIPIMVHVQWLNYDSSVIKMEEVQAGTKPTYSGTTPTKPSTTKYRYNFTGWSPNPAIIYEDTVYTAQFQEVPNTVTATFVKDSSDGGGTIKTVTVNYGETPVFGSSDPTSTKGVPPEITFEGWEPALGPITKNTTYTAVFKDNRPYTVQFLARTIKEYTDVHEALTEANVTWLNWDGSLLELDRDVPIGTTPTYNGATPVGPSDPAYIYTFAGWDKEIVPLTGFTTYTATFTKAIRTFKITFVKASADGGGTLKTINAVNYGDTPVYDGATPTTTKGTAEIFPFEGWEPELGPITADTVYTAKFGDLRPYTVKFLARDIKEYTDAHEALTEANVTWKNWDGEILELDYDIPIGTTPTYNGATPTRPAVPGYTYTFKGWDKEIVPLTGFTTYTATYTEVVETHKATFVKASADGGGTLQTINAVPYNTTPNYTAATPTTSKGTAEVFPFVGWDPPLGPMTQDTTYTAVFDDLRPYTVKFLDRSITEYEG